MSLTIPRVFISSTSEFAAESELLKRELESLRDFRFSAYSYVVEPASSEPPEKQLRGVLEDSEVFVLLLGDTFGSEYPGSAESIVEWEYEFARAHSKELKGYVKDPPGPNVDPRQAAFVARARAFRSGSWIRKFGAAPQLVRDVVADLERWIVKAGELWISKRSERSQWKDRVVLGAAVAVALLTAGGVLAGTFLGLPLERLAVVFGSGITTFGALFVLLKSNVW